LRDELTLKELILATKDYVLYFLRKWFLFLIGILTLAFAFALNAYLTPLTYNAPLTFILSDGKDSGLGLGGVLGEIGLGGGKEGSDAAKILELVRTREILKPVLFDSLTIDDKSQFVADHLIEIYDLHEKWANDTIMRNFRFAGQIPDENDVYGNSALKQLLLLVAGPPKDMALLSAEINEESGIFSFNIESLNPELSAFMVANIYGRMAEFYVDVVTASKRKTFSQLTGKADSVLNALRLAEANLALEEDRNVGVYLKANGLKLKRLSREVLVLSSLYSEVIKNRETASFLLSNENPSFKVIDRPLFPLSISGSSIIKKGIIGGALGFLLVAVVLFLRKLIKNAFV